MLDDIAAMAAFDSETPRDVVERAVDRLVARMKAAALSSSGGAARAQMLEVVKTAEALKKARNPIAVPLATSISEKIIPILMEEDADKYAFKEEERRLATLISRRFGRNIAVLREGPTKVVPFGSADPAEDEEEGGAEAGASAVSPSSRANDDIANVPKIDSAPWPIPCFLHRSFETALNDATVYLLKRLARRKKTEITFYRVMRDCGDDIEKRTEVETELLDPAWKFFVELLKPLQLQKTDDLKVALEILETRAFEYGFNIFPNMGAEFLIALLSLDKSTVKRYVNQISHFAVEAEDVSTFVRRLDKVGNEINTLTLDILILTAFYTSDTPGYLGYRAMHDTLIGTHRQQEVIASLRPILFGEVTRIAEELVAILVAEIKANGLSEDAHHYYDELAGLAAVLNRIMFAKTLSHIENASVNVTGLEDFVIWVGDGAPPNEMPKLGDSNL